MFGVDMDLPLYLSYILVTVLPYNSYFVSCRFMFASYPFLMFQAAEVKPDIALFNDAPPARARRAARDKRADTHTLLKQLEGLPDDDDDDDDEFDAGAEAARIAKKRPREGSDAEDEEEEEEEPGADAEVPGTTTTDKAADKARRRAEKEERKRRKRERKVAKRARKAAKKAKKEARAAAEDGHEDNDDDDDDNDEREEVSGGEDHQKREKRHKKGGNRFIDDAAEASDEDESDDDESDGAEGDLEGLVAEDEEADGDGIDHREIEADLRAAELRNELGVEDADAAEEELLARIRDRWARDAGEDGADRSLAVDQEARLPTEADPQIWAVHVKNGKEREVVVASLRKVVALTARGEVSGVTSIFSKDDLKGYVYVEAFREGSARDILRGNHNVIHSRGYHLVPRDDMVTVVSTSASATGRVKVNAFVRIRLGPYKGDLAQVMMVDRGRGRATVRMLPRLDYAHIAGRQRAAMARDTPPSTARGRARPPAQLFSTAEADSAEVVYAPGQRNPIDNGIDTLVTVGSTVVARIRDGYLLKDVSVKSLITDVSPSLDEMQRFDAENNMSLDAFAAQLPSVGDAASGVVFKKGDKVMVTSGESKYLTGTILRLKGKECDLVPLDPQVLEQIAGQNQTYMTFPLTEVAKYFEAGDVVVVGEGEHAGVSGVVTKVEPSGRVVTLTTTATGKAIKAFSKDLAMADGSAVVRSSLGGYQLYDFVELDVGVCGVILHIDPGAIHVLMPGGSPVEPEMRTVEVQEIRRKVITQQNVAQDARGVPLRSRDVVTVVDGAAKGTDGTVEYVYKGHVWVRGTTSSRVQGYFCVPANEVEARNVDLRATAQWNGGGMGGGRPVGSRRMWAGAGGPTGRYSLPQWVVVVWPWLVAVVHLEEEEVNPAVVTAASSAPS